MAAAPPAPPCRAAAPPFRMTTGHYRTQPDTTGHNRTQPDTTRHNRTLPDTTGHNWTQRLSSISCKIKPCANLAAGCLFPLHNSANRFTRIILSNLYLQQRVEYRAPPFCFFQQITLSFWFKTVIVCLNLFLMKHVQKKGDARFLL